MGCKEEYYKVLVGIEKSPNAVNKDVPEGKELRFDDDSVTEPALLELFKGKRVSDSSVNALAKLMGTLGKKVRGIKQVEFKDIQGYRNAVSTADRVVPWNIALKELFDTQKAEHDKFLRTSNVKTLESISDKGIMNVGLARSAEVIGRKIMYTKGFRIANNAGKGKRISPKEVAILYQKVGMSTLREMEKADIITIRKGNVINDYYKEGDNKKAGSTVKMQVALPKLENLMDKAEYKKNSELFKARLRGENNGMENSAMEDIINMVNAINTAKISPVLSKPGDHAYSKEDQAKNDAMGMTTTGIAFRNALHSNPLVIKDTLVPYFKGLARAWANSSKTFEAFIRNDISSGDRDTLRNVFGVKDAGLFNAELHNSIRGQNKSKLAPLEDFLTFIDDYVDKTGNPKDMFMHYNIVRNARLNMDNSVMNIMGSNYLRHLIGSKKSTLTLDKENEPIVRHFIDSVMDQLSALDIEFKEAQGSQELFDTLLGVEGSKNKVLEEQLGLYALIKKTPNGRNAANGISNLKSKGNMMATFDVLEGINDLRELMKEGTVSTNFNTKSDATASGGSISSVASIGYGDEALEAVKTLGFLKNAEATLDDVYAFLQNSLTNVINGTNTDTNILSSLDLKKQKSLKKFLKVVYNDNMRELSKSPTMTFIYNQGRVGAIQSISEDVVERLLTNLEDPEVAKYAAELLNIKPGKSPLSKLNKRGDLKKDLLEALSNSDKSPIPYIHSKLQEAVDPIISTRKEVIFALFDELENKLGSRHIRILPALARLDLENKYNGELHNLSDSKMLTQYGMPLMKRQNILHKGVEDRDGETYDIVTIEERANKTTSVVNTTHSQDMAIAAIATTEAIKEFKSLYPNEEVPGLGFVHDEIITAPKLGVLVDKHYLKAFAKVTSEYSVEQQLLEQLEVIDPSNPVAKEYRSIIEKANIAKQDAIKDNITEATGKIYGVTKGTYKLNSKPSKPSKPSKGKTENTTENTTSSNIESTSLLNELKSLSTKSSLIKDFLGTNTRVLNKFKKDSFLYNTHTDTIELGKTSSITGNIRGKTMSDDEMIELVEHEITHAYTAAYVAKELAKPVEDRDIKIQYVEKALDNLPYESSEKVTESSSKFKDDSTISRINYIKTRSTRAEQVSEFIAIMKSEKSVADDIYSYFRNVENKAELTAPRDFYKTIGDLIEYVKGLIGKITIDSDALQESLRGIITQGKAYKENNYKEAMKVQKEAYNSLSAASIDPYPEGFDPNKNYNKRDSTKPEIVFGKSINMLNDISKNLLVNNAERLSRNLGRNLDTYLSANFPLYADVRQRVLGLYYESGLSAGLQELVHYTGIGDFKGKINKQEVISKFHTIKEERNAREHKYLKRIKELTKGASKEDKTKMYDLVTKVPIHNFFRFDDEYKTEEDIDSTIKELEGKLTKSQVNLVDDTVHTLVTGEVKKNSVYNLDGFDTNSDTFKELEKLIALNTLKNSNLVDTLFDIRDNNPELYKVIKDNSIALYALSMKLHGMSPKGAASTHTLVKEAFNGRVSFKTISLRDRENYDSMSGWVIVKEPTSKTPGVLVKKVMDETFTEGSGVLDDLPDHDVNVPAHLAAQYDLVKSNIIKVGGRYKLILTKEQKEKAGLVGDMGTSLVKSTSNIIAADDTRFIRNKLTQKGMRAVIKSENDEVIQEVVKKIDSDIIDHPWVLKLEKGVRFDQLDKKIRDRYKPIQQNLSSINGFDKEITHVRKDIRHWLIGGHVKSLFSNPKLQRMSVILKEFIAGSKIGMVMVNPRKIKDDIISNTTHLSLLGVPFSVIASTHKDILKDINSLNSIKNKLLEAKTVYLADPSTSNKAILDDLQNKLEHNGLYTAYSNGFMSSLSSDVLSSDVDTTEGLQADIHKTLTYFLTDKDGNKNTLHKILGSASRFGMDGTDILTSIGKVANSLSDNREVSNYLEGVGKRIREIKNDDDMVRYLANFTISPDAETVKAGTWLNNVSDMLMRETYRRYLVTKGVEPSKAIEKAVAMSPFYPEDMPVGVKMLSDYFIIPFASWTLRVHEPVAYIFKNRLGTVATEEYIASLLDTDLEMYANSHPFNKVLEDSLSANPLSEVGINSMLPTEITSF